MAGVSRELQLTLQSAYQEAVHRRHAFVTVEHLLFALLHDDAGVDIIQSCGGNVESLKQDLERFFREDLEQLPDDEVVESRQTLAFHRVLQHAVDHTTSSEKDEVEIGDLLVALYQEPDSYAVVLLRAQEVDRLDLLQYISHGVVKTRNPGPGEPMDANSRPGVGEETEGVPADPLEAFTANLTEQAAAAELDPMIGRGTELERTLHILARRRKNNPIFVGETGVGKT
ncbi:MAG: Clp protease N-terminal domain-containing protein, partial [Myxococcota bacterium]